MTVRANWHLGDIVVDTSDPFDEEADVVQEGIRVDLTDPELPNGRLVELLLREGQLFDSGVSCALKDLPDTCCSACPLRGSLKTHRISQLCKLGTEQERAVMAIRAADA